MLKEQVCQYLVARSPRHPSADLPCGRRASKMGPGGEYLCGTHVRAMFRRRRLAGHDGPWDREWARRLAGAASEKG